MNEKKITRATMAYFEACEIEMELVVNWQYMETGETKETVFQDWFNKHEYKKI